jgi:hypothetical protein
MGQPMRLVKDLLPPLLTSQWRLDNGEINDAGQISAAGALQGGGNDALMITPVYPSMVLANPMPGIAGEQNTLTITGVTPGKRVYFYYSRNGGGTRIPGCDLQQNALQLDNPKPIGSSIADENGNATISKNVPIAARGQWILMQAVVPGECAISQLVVKRFE